VGQPLPLLLLANDGKFANVGKGGPEHNMTDDQTNCRNCNAPLAGAYCSQCGQREGRGDLSFGALASEVAGEFVSWDSRIWRTLIPLLFRPGFLTAEFIAGRRARYVPPFRLYLIISFVLFLVVSLTTGRANFVYTKDEAQDFSEVSVLAVDEASKAVPADRNGSLASVELRPPDAESSNELSTTTNSDGSSDDQGEEAAGGDRGEQELFLSGEDSPKWLKGLVDRVEENAQSLADDPRRFIQLFTEYLPQMMFLLLPVFALLLKFCYLFSPFYYLQHFVFTLHFHSFVYLLYLLRQLGHFWWSDSPVVESIPLLVLLYLPLALKRSYGSGLAVAIGKSLFALLVGSLLLVWSFAAVAILVLAVM